MTRDYHDGVCHNSQPGTYNHECGKPATWIGRFTSTIEPGTFYTSGRCDHCKQFGFERHAISWQAAS